MRTVDLHGRVNILTQVRPILKAVVRSNRLKELVGCQKKKKKKSQQFTRTARFVDKPSVVVWQNKNAKFVSRSPVKIRELLAPKAHFKFQV